RWTKAADWQDSGLGAECRVWRRAHLIKQRLLSDDREKSAARGAKSSISEGPPSRLVPPPASRKRQWTPRRWTRAACRRPSASGGGHQAGTGTTRDGAADRAAESRCDISRYFATLLATLTFRGLFFIANGLRTMRSENSGKDRNATQCDETLQQVRAS